jgi:hypothetical protein
VFIHVYFIDTSNKLYPNLDYDDQSSANTTGHDIVKQPTTNRYSIDTLTSDRTTLDSKAFISSTDIDISIKFQNEFQSKFLNMNYFS